MSRRALQQAGAAALQLRSERAIQHRSRNEGNDLSDSPTYDPADDSPVGHIGTLVVGTRGTGGPGEVLLSIRGSRECFLAYSDQPMAIGTTVLVVETAPHRHVTVVEWTDPFGSPAT